MAKPRVFVSHSHENNHFCRDFVAKLRALGYDVWYDEHDRGSGPLRETIQRELDTRQHFIVIFTPASLASRWVNREISAAIRLNDQGKMQTFLPVVAECCQIPTLLDGYRRIEGPGGTPYPAAESAIRAAQNLPPGAPDPISPPPAPPIRDPLPPSSPARAPLPNRTGVPKARPSPPRSATPPTTISRRGFLVGAVGAGIAAASGIGLVIWTQNHNIAITALPSSLTALPSSLTALPSSLTALPSSLANLGFGWKTNNGIPYILPPTVPVAAGPFMMGSDPKVDTQAQGNEYLHQVQVGAFEMATYPVTVAEYALAVQAKVVPTPPDTYIAWSKQQTRPDHPVVNVSWLNSLAYVQWLAQISGQAWRLPTGAEWEKAARWDAAAQHARIYPWGDQWDQARANTYGSGVQDTTTVGAYASKGDVSPYGCHDMAGNVIQWCSSIYRDDAYQNDNNHENITDTTSSRVLRGGSWNLDPLYARAASRLDIRPVGLLIDRGFRAARGVGASSH